MNEIYEIPLEQIRPAPWNPPSRLDLTRVKELADSIKREGQKVPALVRPLELGKETEENPSYEIVFGHRRYAAKKLLSEKVDAAYAVLRCEIEEMDEAQAIILSGIENLQREDFTDYEEAEFIRTCGKQYGESAVKVLAEKLSVNQRYVRKRLEFLKLPEVVLDLWRTGIWHVGHMEQFLRLGDQVEEYLRLQQGLFGSRAKDLTVRDLANYIDRMALPLKKAYFDKADCKTCPHNSDYQGKLFGVQGDKGMCTAQECFQTKSQAWLDVNWPTNAGNCNRYGTQRAVLGNYNTKTTGDFGEYSGPKPAEKCLICGHFVTVLRLGQGLENYNYERTCMGEASCFTEVKKASQQEERRKDAAAKGKTLPPDEDVPRVARHGEFFRQEFYQQEIPELMASLVADDPRHLHIALATVLYSAKVLHEWYWQETGQEVPPARPYYSFSVRFCYLLKSAQELPLDRVKTLLAEALVKIALKKDRGYEITFNDEDRQALAEFLEIDWTRFEVTSEYLKKKTKAEILKFIGTELGFREEKLFLDYLRDQRLPTGMEKLAAVKKGVLVDLILNCGVDLRGRLPKEIADKPDLFAKEEESDGLSTEKTVSE